MFLPYNGTQIALTHAQFYSALGSSDDYFSSTAALAQYVEAPWKRGHIFYLGAQGGYTEGTTFANSYFQAGGQKFFSTSQGELS